ncbi:MAG: arginine--tRNA ligase [Pseudomonadota bacterium]|nr:arginine--tRNA ligase [Pseudomonadota bacterium]
MSAITTEIFNQKLLEVILAHNKEFTERLIENSHNQTFFEITNNSEHGDLTTNFAMMHAKSLKMNPIKLAEILVDGFEKNKKELFIKDIKIAGPGFLNLYLDESFWHKTLVYIKSNLKGYGFENIGNGSKANVEYVSANPTGPLHIGHCRGAIIGDVIASLYGKMGFDVTREYYVNDAGGQIEQLVYSVESKYREKASINPNEQDITYDGQYINDIASEIFEKYRDLLFEEINYNKIIKDCAISHILNLIKQDLNKVNIKHDIFFSEASLLANDAISKTIEYLKGKKYIYWGKLPLPKNQEDIDLEQREQDIFASTMFGDDIDRAVSKEDGSHTYFASDIAYHQNKISRGFSKLVNIWGADHAGYVKRLQGAVSALSDGQAGVDVVLCQLVRLFRDDKPVKMSKRNNDYVTIGEVVDEVGSDPVRFMMLYRKSDAPLDFDFVKVCDKSKENPVFYVQYAYARIHSVIRNWNDENNQDFISNFNRSEVDFNMLNHSQEIALIKKMSYFPVLLKNVVITNDVHRIAFYLHDLASDFHALWNLGNDNENMRFITSDDKKTLQRLAFIYLVSQIIETGLDLLGVSYPERM